MWIVLQNKSKLSYFFIYFQKLGPHIIGSTGRRKEEDGWIFSLFFHEGGRRVLLTLKRCRAFAYFSCRRWRTCVLISIHLFQTFTLIEQFLQNILTQSMPLTNDNSGRWIGVKKVRFLRRYEPWFSFKSFPPNLQKYILWTDIDHMALVNNFIQLFYIKLLTPVQ